MYQNTCIVICCDAEKFHLARPSRCSPSPIFSRAISGATVDDCIRFIAVAQCNDHHPLALERLKQLNFLLVEHV